MAGRRATGRAIWLALGLLPLAAWLVLAILASPPGAVQPSTGDALLDKYCAALLKYRLPRELNGGGKALGEVPLKDSVFRGWEKEFGSDPRYWMLRYYNAGLDSFPLEVADSILVSHPEERPGLRRRISYLEEARRRGIADGAVLLTLLRWQEAIWTATEYEPLDRPGSSKRLNLNDVMQAGRESIDANHAAEEAELLQELQAAAPDEALPHYYAALYASQREDYGIALAELSRGNRLPRHSMLTGFPYDEFWRRMRHGEALADEVTSGLICWDAKSEILGNFYDFKVMSNDLLTDAIKHQDLAVLAELHTFGVRYGDSESCEPFSPLVGYDMVSTVWRKVNLQWPTPLNSEQQQALTALKLKLDQLEAALLAASNTPVRSTNPGLSHQPFEAAMQLLSSGRGDAVQALEILYEYRKKEQQALGGRIHELFQEVARFDYNTFSWREE